MSRRLLTAAVVCLGLLLPAGCVRMPDSGPVVQTGSGGSLVLAWLFVGVPLAWGVTQTFIKALTLFK